MMKKIKLIAYLFIAICTLNSCTDEVDPQGTNYVTFESDSYSFGVTIDGEDTKTITVYAASMSASARTLEIVVVSDETTADAASYTVPASFTIPANSNVAEIPVTISDLNIGDDGKTLTLGLVSKEGFYIGGNIALKISRLCADGTKSLKILIDNTDGYPDEIKVDLINSAGVTIFSVAGGELTGDYEFKECTPTGDYTLNIVDTYGDGGTAYTVSSDGNILGTIAADSYTTDASLTFSL
tara:strand:+ start:4853 stop:5572 length:720 start_codon:yes stop_codon:yes gene_type:complete